MIALDNMLAEARAQRELLESLVRQVATLQAAVDRLAPPSALKPADMAVLKVLLPALALAFPGGRAFKVREAKLSSHLVRQITATVSAKSLGKLLAKAEGHIVEQCIVRGAGEESGTALWVVERLEVLSGLSKDLKAA